MRLARVRDRVPGSGVGRSQVSDQCMHLYEPLVYHKALPVQLSRVLTRTPFFRLLEALLSTTVLCDWADHRLLTRPAILCECAKFVCEDTVTKGAVSTK